MKSPYIIGRLRGETRELQLYPTALNKYFTQMDLCLKKQKDRNGIFFSNAISS